MDREINVVANPRIGQFLFNVPNNHSIVKSWPTKSVSFFLTGGASLLGNPDPMRRVKFYPLELEKYIDDTDGDKIARVRLDGFLSQPILLINGFWISRKAIIKYVSYIASGIHPLPASYVPSDEERAIAQIRRSVYFIGGVLNFDFEKFLPPRIDDAPHSNTCRNELMLFCSRFFPLSILLFHQTTQ